MLSVRHERHAKGKEGGGEEGKGGHWERVGAELKNFLGQLTGCERTWKIQLLYSILEDNALVPHSLFYAAYIHYGKKIEAFFGWGRRFDS